MKYKDLRDFIAQLEHQGELKRVTDRDRSSSGDDRNLRPRVESRRSGDSVRKTQGAHHSRAGKPVRHAPARSDGHGAGIGRSAAGSGKASGLSERTRAAQGLDGCMGKIPGAEAGPQHGAEGAIESPLPGNRMGRQGRGPRQAAHPDLLAGRRRPADHLGVDRHQRAAQDPAEPGHLPPAGDRAEQADHALAGPSRRGARLSRLLSWPIRASRIRSRWRWGRTRPPYSVPSRRCRIP